MKAKQFIYTAIILFPFFASQKANAQRTTERKRSVTITQTVIDGKVVSADTLITYTDTTTRTVNSKEVSMEMPYTKGGTVYIDNTYRKLNIRESKDGKVRLSTTTFYYGEPAFTNEQWLEKLNIKMRKADSGIVITSSGINNTGFTSGSWSNNSYSYSFPEPPRAIAPLTITGHGSTQNEGNTVTQNGALDQVIINGQTTTNTTRPATTRGWSSTSTHSTAVFDENGNVSYNSTSLRRELTLYIPADAKLNIISKYADVSVDHDLADIKTSISNASLDMLNANKVNILSTYGNLSMGNVADAHISITSGKLFMKDVVQLQLITKYTKVEAGNCGTLKMQSISDDYDIDEVKSLSGTKAYGNLRIDKLTGNFDMKGSSADTKIRNIEPSVSAITIDNKYADVRLPVTSLKNYEVLFSGNYSSVFAPFDKKDTTVEKQATSSGQISTTTDVFWYKQQPALSYTGSVRKSNGFSAVVGDTKGTHTMFNLTCTSCNVDFK